MGLLLKTLNLMACTYLVSGQLNLDDLDDPPTVILPTVYDTMENVAEDYNTVMVDLGEYQNAVGPDEVHLGKILNVIRELTHAKFIDSEDQKNNYTGIVAKALGAHIHDIRTAMKTEMQVAKTLHLNLIQQTIDVICKSLNRHQCTEEVDTFFYEAVPKMDDNNRKKYQDAKAALFSIHLSFNHLLSPTIYETMKQYAHVSNSALYVYSYRNIIDSLVDEWVETLRAVFLAFPSEGLRTSPTNHVFLL